MDLIPVATPDPGADRCHAADRVVGLAQIQQVVVGQVPLAVSATVEYSNSSICQCCQHSSLDMPVGSEGEMISYTIEYGKGQEGIH